MKTILKAFISGVSFLTVSLFTSSNLQSLGPLAQAEEVVARPLTEEQKKEFDTRENLLTEEVFTELQAKNYSAKKIQALLAIKDQKKSRAEILKRVSPELRKKFNDLEEDKKRATR